MSDVKLPILKPGELINIIRKTWIFPHEKVKGKPFPI